MPTVRVNEVEIYYEVHGQGQAIYFLARQRATVRFGNFIRSPSSLKITW